MNRQKIRSLAAVAVTATLVLSAAAGPATAKPGKGAGKAATKAAAKAKTGKVRPAKPVKGVQPYTAQKRVAAKRIAATDAALERQEQRVAAAGLADEAAVLANITADREVLTGYTADLAAATTLTEVRALTVLVAAVRPEVYSLVVNGLRQAAHSGVVAPAADAEIQELAALANAKEAEAHDVTAVRVLLADAASAVAQLPGAAAAVVVTGTTVTAQSTATEREAFAGQVEALEALLDQVETTLAAATELLDAMVPVGEPVTDPVV